MTGSLLFGVYSINGGSTGSISLISTKSMSWSANTNSLITNAYYMSMSLGSWSLTPGPYVFGFAFSTSSNGTVLVAGVQLGNFGQLAIATNIAQAMTDLRSAIFCGYYSTTTNAMPTSVAVSDTAAWVRTGNTVRNQPWFLLQGT